jgi:hypothetical protein
MTTLLELNGKHATDTDTDTEPDFEYAQPGADLGGNFDSEAAFDELTTKTDKPQRPRLKTTKPLHRP